MSILTLPPTAIPDPPEPTAAQLRDLVALLNQEHGELLNAARATLAADARNMSNPLGFLRDHLTAINSLPETGAWPSDYQPNSPDGGVWGRR